MLRLRSPEGIRAGGDVRTKNTHRRNIVAFINGLIFEDGIFAVPVSLLVSVAHRVKLPVRFRHRKNDFSCVVAKVRPPNNIL